VTHRAAPRFWRCYNALPEDIRRLADRCYALLKSDPARPSLHFKKIGQFWTARVGLHHRAVAVEAGADRVWFWIGSHADYDKLLGRKPANKRLQPTAASGPGRKRARGKKRRRG
jgi:hypothetical protein